MYKPNITMACVVHCKGKFLFVEEFEYGKMTLNQPAGHLEKMKLFYRVHKENYLKKPVFEQRCKTY